MAAMAIVGLPLRVSVLVQLVAVTLASAVEQEKENMIHNKDPKRP